MQPKKIGRTPGILRWILQTRLRRIFTQLHQTTLNPPPKTLEIWKIVISLKNGSKHWRYCPYRTCMRSQWKQIVKVFSSSSPPGPTYMYLYIANYWVVVFQPTKYATRSLDSVPLFCLLLLSNPHPFFSWPGVYSCFNPASLLYTSSPSNFSDTLFFSPSKYKYSCFHHCQDNHAPVFWEDCSRCS